ncbi:MAG: WcaI family glycosyltransferase [Gammaproteobacteria bacterium]|nr:WcaI family glycosyltransferase [Gammaproteobacteria bacterium]
MNKVDSRRLLVVALNYAPDLTGIGKYVSEMTEWLTTEKQLAVRVVTAPPYYPAWSVADGYSAARYRKESIGGITVYRCPLWVPRKPRGITRILHLLSFALSSLPVLLWQAVSWRPHVVFVVEPPLGAAPGAWLAAKLCGAQAWLHVQDFEVDAAFELGLIPTGTLQRAILAAERALMRSFDRVSNISDRMLARLLDKGVDQRRAFLFPNWVDVSLIHPLENTDALRAELGIDAGRRVLLYSGNMGEKQGLELIVEVARRFDAPDALFLLCGDGAARPRLEAAAADLANVRFIPLQPLARLNELLNLADVHLLPQRAAAEDLVMPSKLTGIMASGRPVVATAAAGSDVARIARHGGIVVPPGDAQATAGALRRLLNDATLRRQLGDSGRAFALDNWERNAVLQRAFEELQSFAWQIVKNPWLLILAATAVILLFQGTFGYLYAQWQRSEYSHGVVIPLISAYLLWRQRARFADMSWRPAWSGAALALFGLMLYVGGRLVSVTTLDGYALVIVIAGCVLGIMGWEAFKVALVPIALLFLMNPLPQGFYDGLSYKLQLLSSELGVALMRLCGVSVLLDGNAIELGKYKLPMADAGLRYLFPMMTLGVIIAYLFRGRPWMRWCLFVSTIPITLLMNSLRVGVTGILVDRFSIAQAEGLLPWFEGWAFFIVSLLVLLAEAWALLRLTGDGRSLREALTPELHMSPVPQAARAPGLRQVPFV